MTTVEIRRAPDPGFPRVADIPALAGPRLKARRFFRELAFAGLLCAIANVLLVAEPAYSGDTLSTVVACVSVWLMLNCEKKARIMTKQLKRPAADQIARDIMRVGG